MEAAAIPPPDAGDEGSHADASHDAPAEALADATIDSSADGGAEDGGEVTDDGGCTIDPISGEPKELACTTLYSDWATKTVAPDIVQFAPGLVLWSDGAVKTRWIWLPPGTKIDTSNMDEWIFPVGTRFYKQFVVNGVYVETRMLHKQAPSGWSHVTYRWAPDLSSATMSPGATNVNDAGYEIPTSAECKDCHQGRQDFILGFEAVSLSAPLATGLTMDDLVKQDLVTKAPSAPLTVPGDAIQSAALGYLHANCGTACHNPFNGEAAYTGFWMRLNVAELGSVAATDTYMTGWGVGTRTDNFVSDGVTQRIVPCNAPASCVYFRDTHRDGLNAPVSSLTQMPPIDTHRIDDAGVAAVAAWINEGCGGGGGDAGQPNDSGADH
jgi:hypothetical protein